MIGRNVLTFKEDRAMVLEGRRVMPDGEEVKMMGITSRRR